tara:strand:+ start:626 stop:1210 length:585 start_codon:yes stop_codon:yes gene_type:complete
MKFKLFEFENVTSTNDIAINLIKDKKRKTGCIYAKSQSKGRGTHGRKWVSDKGNLFLSIFFPLKNDFPSFSEFSFINPLIISSVIGHFCSKDNINLKFPNDILVNRKKICGILQEVITKNSQKFLIIGIGINIVSNPSINKKYKATNIFMQTKKKPDKKRIIDLIINSYENFFSDLKSYNFIKIKKKANLMALN